ncbi:ribosome recycling factor [soil metagenome]
MPSTVVRPVPLSEENDMSVSEIIKDAEQKMQAAIDAMSHDFDSYRTGRATPAILDRVHVDYYGTETPISQLANISIPEPRQLLIQPWDKSTTPLIERAIMKSDLGINPNNDGTGIRLTFPQMTEDRRKDMVKQIHARLEQCKVTIRNIRRDSNDQFKALEKKKEIGEDDEKGGQALAQKITDKFVARADELGKKKDEELMTI